MEYTLAYSLHLAMKKGDDTVQEAQNTSRDKGPQRNWHSGTVEEQLKNINYWKQL